MAKLLAAFFDNLKLVDDRQRWLAIADGARGASRPTFALDRSVIDGSVGGLWFTNFHLGPRAERVNPDESNLRKPDWWEIGKRKAGNDRLRGRGRLGKRVIPGYSGLAKNAYPLISRIEMGN
jgi:hypothetical protein